MNFDSNPNKNLNIKTKYGEFSRFPIKTQLIKPDDNLFGIIKKYALPYIKNNDILFISEKVIA
ncbi:MAG: F420-0--gamma-glutamyl ligase, partial [Nanoarchaeota archaeon]|nr:F420-0--gamma-glutamyl ligase [Nanoarchaeota archaeon]